MEISRCLMNKGTIVNLAWRFGFIRSGLVLCFRLNFVFLLFINFFFFNLVKEELCLFGGVWSILALHLGRCSFQVSQNPFAFVVFQIIMVLIEIFHFFVDFLQYPILLHLLLAQYIAVELCLQVGQIVEGFFFAAIAYLGSFNFFVSLNDFLDVNKRFQTLKHLEYFLHFGLRVFRHKLPFLHFRLIKIISNDIGDRLVLLQFLPFYVILHQLVEFGFFHCECAEMEWKTQMLNYCREIIKFNSILKFNIYHYINYHKCNTWLLTPLPPSQANNQQRIKSVPSLSPPAPTLMKLKLQVSLKNSKERMQPNSSKKAFRKLAQLEEDQQLQKLKKSQSKKRNQKKRRRKNQNLQKKKRKKKTWVWTCSVDSIQTQFKSIITFIYLYNHYSLLARTITEKFNPSGSLFMNSPITSQLAFKNSSLLHYPWSTGHFLQPSSSYSLPFSSMKAIKCYQTSSSSMTVSPLETASECFC